MLVKRTVDRIGRLWTVASLALVVGGCQSQPPVASGPPQRVISLTPSLTEIVMILGARDRLVGVDQFSRRSPDVAKLGDVSKLPIAGDFVAPNVEVIARMKPDLIVFDAAQAKAAASLAGAGYRTLSIEMHSIADVRAALVQVADALGRAAEGEKAVQAIDEAIATAKESRSLTSKPRVLWIIDRAPGALSGLIGAGPGSYGDELLRLVGSQNVLAPTSIRYPKISREALERLEIDLVIDSSGAAQESMKEWPTPGSRVVAALPTSAAIPRPNLPSSLQRIGELVRRAARDVSPPSKK